MMLIFKLLGRYLGKFFRAIPAVARFIPSASAGIFIVIDFFMNLIQYNLPYAFEQTAITIFGAELTINQAVHLAIADVPEYNFFMFLRIILSLYILFSVVKFFTLIQLRVSGAQAPFSAGAVSVLITGIISLAGIAVIEGSFGFVPIKDSIVFLIVNLKPVLFNIFGSSAVLTVPNVVNMTQNASVVV